MRTNKIYFNLYINNLGNVFWGGLRAVLPQQNRIVDRMHHVLVSTIFLFFFIYLFVVAQYFFLNILDLTEQPASES